MSATITTHNRLEKLRVWLDVLDDALDIYDDLQSRPEESSSLSGFAPEAWRRGRCGQCDGLGCTYDAHSRARYLDLEDVNDQRLRGKVLADAGWVYYRNVDPYREGANVRTSWNGGELSKTVRDARARDASIARLERMEMMRAGLEVSEDRDVRQLRLIDQRLRGFTRRLRGAVDSLPGDLRRAVARRDPVGLAALDRAVPGRIPRPPAVYVRQGR